MSDYHGDSDGHLSASSSSSTPSFFERIHVNAALATAARHRTYYAPSTYSSVVYHGYTALPYYLAEWSPTLEGCMRLDIVGAQLIQDRTTIRIPPCVYDFSRVRASALGRPYAYLMERVKARSFVRRCVRVSCLLHISTTDVGIARHQKSGIRLRDIINGNTTARESYTVYMTILNDEYTTIKEMCMDWDTNILTLKCGVRDAEVVIPVVESRFHERSAFIAVSVPPRQPATFILHRSPYLDAIERLS
ncbi:hypothetical protein BJ912DRAFT_1045101 [Pholiota molesta]|nr:hypothetical protein BJ912DRAFT_1045101 [Pholiota molesta]